MRYGRYVPALALIAATAACGDEGMDTYEAEETATPAVEAPATEPAADAALLTATFEPPENATETGQQVTGTLRIFPAGGAANARQPAQPGQATPDATNPDAPTSSAAAPDGEMSASSTGAGQGFRVEVSLDGLSQGDHAWHIHSGPCGEQAPVAVAFSPTADQEGLTQPLTADQQGHAEGTVTVPAGELALDQLQGQEYSVHVHAQGGTDHGPTVACADLDSGFGG